VLSHVRAPGNFGTLIRTSAAVGAAGFILQGSSVDPFDPAVVRASMGALVRQAFICTSIAQLREWAHQHRLQVVGASPDGTVAYDQLHYTHPTLLLLGEERSGLSAEQRALAILIEKAVVSQGNTRSAFFVQLTVTTDPIAEPQNGSVVRMGNTRART